MLTKKEIRALRLKRLDLLDEKCNPCGETNREVCELCPVFHEMQTLNYKIEHPAEKVTADKVQGSTKRSKLIDKLMTVAEYKEKKSNGMKDKEIADELIVTYHGLGRWKRKHGLTEYSNAARSLRPEQVRSIRKHRNNANWTIAKIATKFNVAESTIEKILSGQTYKDVL